MPAATVKIIGTGEEIRNSRRVDIGWLMTAHFVCLRSKKIGEVDTSKMLFRRKLKNSLKNAASKTTFLEMVPL